LRRINGRLRTSGWHILVWCGTGSSSLGCLYGTVCAHILLYIICFLINYAKTKNKRRREKKENKKQKTKEEEKTKNKKQKKKRKQKKTKSI
jgi:mannitol-specific phosphotransferase system IIBC component